MCESVDWIHMAHDRVPVTVWCEDGNEPSGAVKGGERLDQSRDSTFLKENSTPWSYERFLSIVLYKMVEVFKVSENLPPPSLGSTRSLILFSVFRRVTKYTEYFRSGNDNGYIIMGTSVLILCETFSSVTSSSISKTRTFYVLCRDTYRHLLLQVPLETYASASISVFDRPKRDVIQRPLRLLIIWVF